MTPSGRSWLQSRSHGDTSIATPAFTKVTIPDEGVETLFGSYDENLKNLERACAVEIRTDGRDLLIRGDPERLESVENVLGQLATLAQEGYVLSAAEVTRAAQLVLQDRTVDLHDYFTRAPLRASSKRQITPKSVNQRRYLAAIEQYDLVFGVGPAGTGKTYLAMAEAVAFLTSKRVSRIILARPAVEAGEKLGFLPGDLQEKVNPYLRPLYDALHDMLDGDRVARLLDRGVIEIAPLAFMRGRTLNDAFVILDEAQNTTSEQMKMFLTRLGYGSKAVITGDVTQVDLPAGRVSGLVEAVHVVRAIEGVARIRFDERDVVRHPLVQAVVKAYEAHASSGS